MAMTIDEFRNALCALRFIDAHQLVARGCDPLLAKQFIANPTGVFVAEPSAREAAWAVLQDHFNRKEPQR